MQFDLRKFIATGTTPIMQSFSVIYLHMIMPGQGSRSRSPLFLKRRRTATRSG